MTECPRWRLRLSHYLNVLALPDGTVIEWEHKETDRTSGRAIRKLYPVPCLLDPTNPGDCNYPGEIIVTTAAEGAIPTRQDILFIGDPTPDMEPLNEAAEAISESHRQRWEHPINSLPANGGMNAQEQAFMDNMMKMFSGAAQAQNTSVPKEQYDELKERLAKLEAMLAGQNKAPVVDARRA